MDSQDAGEAASRPAGSRTRSRDTPPSNALRDAWRFVRDVVWLLGWGISRISAGARSAARSPEGRGSLGCLASVGALLTGLVFWRRRKSARRLIRRISPTRARPGASDRTGR